MLAASSSAPQIERAAVYGKKNWGWPNGNQKKLCLTASWGSKPRPEKISDEALWHWVGQRLSLNQEELADFRHGFWAGDVLDTELVDYIRGLRPSYQTAIISNATDNLRRQLTTTYPIADAFDLIVCSAEEGIMKPDPVIYQRTLERLGRQPAETVFIDDFPHNIAAARELGMNAIHFQPSIDIPAEFGKLGVKSNGKK